MNFKETIDALSKHIPYGDTVAIVLIILYATYNIISFFLEKLTNVKEKHIKNIESIINLPCIDTNTKKMMEQNLIEIYFQQITGLNISNHQQKALVELYNHNNQKVNFQHYQRIITHIKLDSTPKIVINLPRLILNLIIPLLICTTFLFPVICSYIKLYKSSYQIKLIDFLFLPLFILFIYITHAAYTIIKTYLMYCSFKHVEKQINDKNGTSDTKSRTIKRTIIAISTIGIILGIIYSYIFW